MAWACVLALRWEGTVGVQESWAMLNAVEDGGGQGRLKPEERVAACGWCALGFMVLWLLAIWRCLRRTAVTHRGVGVRVRGGVTGLLN